jgi:hypothetical protein
MLYSHPGDSTLFSREGEHRCRQANGSKIGELRPAWQDGYTEGSALYQLKHQPEGILHHSPVHCSCLCSILQEESHA